MEARIWEHLVDEVALELCFEMHRQVKVDGMSLDELYDVEPIEPREHAPVERPQTLVVTCSRCQRQVHASRYAPHLEKCMVGSRRQAASNGPRQSLPPTDRDAQALQRIKMPDINSY